MSEIKKGAVLSYATVAFNAFAGLLYTPWMILSIGADDYALYTLALSIVNFFLLDFGLGDSVSRFLSVFYARGEDDKVPVFLGIVYKLFALLALAVAVVFAVVFVNVDTIYANLGPEMLLRFKVVFATVSSYSVLAFPFTPLKGILVANECFVGLNACNLLQKVCTVLLIVFCLLAGRGVYALVTVNAFCACFFVVAKYIIVRRRTGARADFKAWDGETVRSVFGFSVWVTLIQVFQRMVFSIAPSVLAAFSNTWEVALFGLASSIEGYVWGIASALNGMFMPKVARTEMEGPEALQRLMVRIGRIQLMIIGFVFAAFVGLGGLFVECWMGAAYGALYPCAILLILPSFFELPQLIGDTALLAGDYVKSKVRAYSVMATVNLVGLVALSGPLGSEGACLSICFAYLLRTVLMDLAYSSNLRINILRFFRDVYLRWVPIGLVTAAAGLVATKVVPFHGWVAFFGLIVGLFSLYVTALFVFYMGDEEKELARDFFSGGR